MSDLERLWDDLPVGRPPLARIRRLATAGGSPPRRPYRRPLLTAAALAGVGGAFLTGIYVGDGDGGRGTPGAGPDARPVAFHGELRSAESCDDLLDHYVSRGVKLVGAYGWELMAHGDLRLQNLDQASGGVPLSEGFANRDRTLSKSLRAPMTQRSESSEAGTNVQEAGVDEPDVVKTDGERLYRLQDGTLTIHDVRGDEPEEVSELELGRLPEGEILLVGDTLLALGRHQERTRVLRVDVSDPTEPQLAEHIVFDSTLLTARLHGDTVRLATSAGLPELDFVRPGRPKRGGLSWHEARRRNREVVRETSISDWLPTGSVGGGTDKRLAECEDVAVPKRELGLDTVSVIGFAADDPADWTVTALAADAALAYVSQEHLYLATGGVAACWEGCIGTIRSPTPTSDGRTHVFAFELTGRGTSYAGAGVVDGAVRDRWAMDESRGVLRLALSPTHRTGNFNSVVTLRADDDELVEVGRLDHLGDNEQIQSVRWFDNLAIVVTFRQVDPLYTIDLSDPEAPKQLGKLKVPGFSEYLHPIGPRRLIGVGQGPVPSQARGRSWGAQAGLFRTVDLTSPTRLDVVHYRRGTQAHAGSDPRQFTWLPEQRVALTVIADGWNGRTGWVSVLTLAEGRMSNRMIEAEHGWEQVTQLRTVPLPDGRVVLSRVDGAEFLGLG